MNKYYYLKVDGIKENQPAICPPFVWKDSDEELRRGEFTIIGQNIIFNFDDGEGGIENFKKWLKNEEKNGRPVVLQYVLDKPDTIELKGDLDIEKIMFESKHYSFTEIANSYGIDNYILFRCDFPYYLQISNGIYNMNTDKELIETQNTLSNGKRNIIYCSYIDNLKNQKISTKSGCFNYNILSKEYSFFITHMDILIEIKEQEIMNENNFLEEKNVVRILQSVLEIIASKYNEALNGKDFWYPLAQETGALRVGMFSKNTKENNFILKNALITPGIAIEHKDELKKDKFEEMLDRPYDVWKYFFNESLYCYDNYRNLECVIYSAICIEAYFYNILLINDLEQKFEAYQIERKRKGKSFFNLVEFLSYEKIINKEDEKFINENYGQINTIRNNIVHGKISTPIISRNAAEISKVVSTSIIKKFEN